MLFVSNSFCYKDNKMKKIILRSVRRVKAVVITQLNDELETLGCDRKFLNNFGGCISLVKKDDEFNVKFIYVKKENFSNLETKCDTPMVRTLLTVLHLEDLSSDIHHLNTLVTNMGEEFFTIKGIEECI